MEFPLVGLRWNIYPQCLVQNVQDLDVGQLELFLRGLNVKYAGRLQNFTNASRSRKSAMFVFHKPVLSLARPNFLTGAIIETRFQASLLAPPEKNKPRVNHEPRSAHGRAVKKNKPRVEHEPHSAHGHAVKKKK